MGTACSVNLGVELPSVDAPAVPTMEGFPDVPAEAQKVAEIAKAELEKFGVAFMISYASALLKDTLGQLEDPPTITDKYHDNFALKGGSMEYLLHGVRQVAFSAEDKPKTEAKYVALAGPDKNYSILIFKDKAAFDQGPDKAEKILCPYPFWHYSWGWTWIKLTPDESLKEHSLQIKLDNDDECWLWGQAISYAYWGCTPDLPEPALKDKVLATAFQAGYESWRNQQPGWYGPRYGYAFTSAQHLALLLSDKVNREHLPSVLEPVPSAVKGKAEEALREAFKKAIQGAVDAGWPGILKAAGSATAKIKEKLQSSKDAISQASDSVLSSLANGLRDQVDAFVGPLVQRAGQAGINAVAPALKAAYAQVFANLEREYAAAANKEQFIKEHTNYRGIYLVTRPAHDELSKTAAKLSVLDGDGWSASNDGYHIFAFNIETLAFRALVALSNTPLADVRAAWANDAPAAAFAGVVQCFADSLSAKFVEAVKGPIETVVGSVTGQIPETAKEILDVEGFAVETARRLFVQCTQALFEPHAQLMVAAFK